MLRKDENFMADNTKKFDAYVDSGFSIDVPDDYDIDNLTQEQHEFLAKLATAKLLDRIRDNDLSFSYDDDYWKSLEER